MKPPTGCRRGRFAPSPTGSLHLGNARTALVAWLRARATGDSFVLRTEDLDSARTVPDAISGNLNELRWLGLDWDEGPDVGGPHAPYVQSERHEHYLRALDYLELRELTFHCWLSRKDLRELASAPHTPPAAYGTAERQLNEQLQATRQESGKQPGIRLKAAEAAAGRTYSFTDVIQGVRRLDPVTSSGDIILKRADGMWAYQLAVVVDDILMGIREVVRGADLLPSTGAQLLLYDILEQPPPTYLHVGLLLDESGERLSKRNGPLSLAELREGGTDPARLTGLLAFSLGLLKRPEPLTPVDLVERLPDDWPAGTNRSDFRLESRLLAWLQQ